MQEVNLEKVYRFLENPDSFTDEEISGIQRYLIAIKEKLNHLNREYNLNIEMSAYITSIFEKEHVTV